MFPNYEIIINEKNKIPLPPSLASNMHSDWTFEMAFRCTCHTVRRSSSDSDCIRKFVQPSTAVACELKESFIENFVLIT